MSAAEREDAMLRFDSVRFAYAPGAFELRVPEFRLRRGERVALIGPSGSGKTTLADLASGLLVADEGEVRLAGRALGALSETERRALRSRSVGFVFQRFELIEYLSALDNLLLPFHLNRSLPFGERERGRARELARAVGVEHVLGRRPARLSQGERQRIALCRALVNEPDLVLADEPTGNLDPSSADAALELLTREVEVRGAALLVITHDHDLLARFDRVVDIRSLAAGSAP